MKNNSFYLYFILSVVFILVPLTFFKSNDFWDGVSVSFAFETKKYNSLDEYMLQGGYYFQYLLYKIIFLISETFNFSYKYLINLIYTITIIFLAIECKIISKNVFKLNNYYSKLSGIILIIFPIWHILVSSIFISHVICVLFVFLGTRFLSNRSISKQVLGILILFLSYELKSNFLFSIILVFCYDFINFLNTKSKNFRKTIFIFILNIFIFQLIKTFFPPSGLWEGHNQIINILDTFNFKHLIWNSIQFSSFYAPVIFINLIFFLYNREKILKLNTNEITKNEDFKLMSVLIVLSLSSIVPYILVLKSSRLIFDSQFSPRNALLLACTISLLITFNLNLINKNKFKKHFLDVISPIIICIFLFSSVFLFFEKYNYLKFRDHLISELKLKDIKAGIVVLNGDGIPDPIIITKESNFIFWKSFNESKWATHILADKNIPRPTTERFSDNKGNIIYLAENFKMKCITYGNIFTDDYKGFANILKNMFINKTKSLYLKLYSEDCV
tara:strand:- start:366 stop:1871 length:1506 start_codon:yes stop_codon:yes gene_type:complete